MKKNRLLRLTAFLLCLPLILTGCWDKIEIEDRTFVLSIGFDKAKDGEKIHSNDKYLINFTSPILGGGEGGVAQGFKTFNSVGDSFSECMMELLRKSGKKQFFGHTRVALMGEELLQDEKSFKELLDNIGRSHDLYKNMYMYAVPGRADDVFKVKPIFNKLLTPYITGITENHMYESSISKVKIIDFLISVTDQDGGALLPVLEPQQPEGANISKLAVIKDYKFAGYLSPSDATVTNWLNDKVRGGVLEVKLNNATVPFRYFTLKRKIKLDKVEDNKMYVTYEIETEGSVEEYSWGEKLLDENTLSELEKMLESEIISTSKATIKKYQEEYKIDLIGLRGYLSKFHPKLYRDIEKNYNDYFSNNIVIDVKADAKVRRVGLIK